MARCPRTTVPMGHPTTLRPAQGQSQPFDQANHWRAITVHVPQEPAFGPHDLVDVWVKFTEATQSNAMDVVELKDGTYTSRKPPRSNAETVKREPELLAKRVKVLGVNADLSKPDSKSITRTLLVTSSQASKIAAAQQIGTVYLLAAEAE